MANEQEAAEIAALPEKYRPLGMWAYFGYTILFNIPIVGFICTIVFAFSDANIARRNYARSFFCIYIICIVVVLLLSVTGMYTSLISGTVAHSV